jgi:hypothetical protein
MSVEETGSQICALRGYYAEWSAYSVTHVSGQPIGPAFKG